MSSCNHAPTAGNHARTARPPSSRLWSVPSSVTIRPRQPADVGELSDVLARQQPHSGYPLRWPLPFDPEQMIVRSSELAAWTAELDGVPVGHASLTDVADDDLGRIWSQGAGRPVTELACLSALFLDHTLQGHGIGGRLLDTAEDFARARDLTLVLDVVVGTGPAISVYRHRGWVEVGRARPPWLPDSEPPVLMMVLPEEAGSRSA